MLTFQEKLQNYASIAVNVGVRLQPGQRLLVLCPVEAAPLARLVVEEGYKAGARLVEVLWNDDEVTLRRFQFSQQDHFDEVAPWTLLPMLDHARSGDAVISIRGADPALLKGQNPQHIQSFNGALTRLLEPYFKHVLADELSWTVLAAPVPGWSRTVFPGLPHREQQAELWEALFRVTRADQPDPLQLWHDHLEALERRARHLTRRAYRALHFRGPHADLQVGLPAGHQWGTAQHTTVSGIRYCANLPTEEVFTLPHREKVQGWVRSTRPLSHQGQLIQDLELTFEGGQVVQANAARGAEALRQLIATDPGAARLGEVALVSHSSPVQRSGLLFYHTLLDENAACHLALGNAYPGSLQGGTGLDNAEFAARGGNLSTIHVDFMVGSADLQVDGLLPDGTQETLLQQGEFVQDF